MSKPNVAIITSLTGGLGHYAAHLANPLSKRCKEVKFITYPQTDLLGTVVKEITDPIVKKYVKWPKFYIDEVDPHSIIKINKYLDSKNIDIINIHVATTVKRKINYFLPFALYSKSRGRKIVLTLHDVLPIDSDDKLTPLVDLFYKMADHFTVGNELEKEKLIKNFNIPVSKISVVPHGIYDLFDNKLYNKETARKFLNIPKDKKVVLFFGFLRKYKGFEQLIKATHQLTNKYDDFIVYVSSGLKYAPEDLAEKSKALIASYKLEDVFHLNLKYIETSDIEIVFKACDLVVLPYTHASQSGVAMMAFGFNKPVIITNAFYDKVWIKNKAGLVAKPSDSKDLANKIAYMFDNPDKIESFGRYGYEYSVKNFSWEKIADKYCKIYKKINNSGTA